MSQVSKENAGTVSESYITDQGEVISSQSTSGDTSKDHNNSEEEEYELTVAEAKEMLRDIIALCEQQPNKKSLEEERNKAKGNPRAAMLSVVPKVVAVADEALSERVKHQPSTRSWLAAAAASASTSAHMDSSADGNTTTHVSSPGPLLLGFLKGIKHLVQADSSGMIKKDLRSLRTLLSPP